MDMEIYTMPGHLIRRLNQIAVAVFADEMAAAGLSITPVQFAALRAVQTHPGIDQATVAGLIAYDRATIGKVIDRLEARGLLARCTSERDRRAKELRLTADGNDLVAAAIPIARGIQPRILSGLTEDERSMFTELLNRVTLAGNELSRAPLRPAPTPPD